MGGPLDPLDPLTEDMGQTPPQTEDSVERGHVDKDDHAPDLGQSAELDSDAGDIADEGAGGRG
jgi:hypothetical protein